MIQPRTRIGVTALALAMLGAAAPAAAETLTVTGITTTLPDGAKPVLSVPAVSVVDGNLDEAAIRSLFASGPAGVAGDLAGLDAALVSIPLITLSDRQLAYPLVVLRNVTLEDVSAGRAARMAIGSFELDIDAERSFRSGTLSADDFDLGALLALYGLVEPTGDRTQLRPVYASAAFAGGSFTSPEATCTFNPVEAGPFAARPLAPGAFADLMRISAESNGKEPAPEDLARIVTIYADLLTAYTTGEARMSGFACDVDMDGQRGTMTFGGVTQGASRIGITPDVTYSDLVLEGSDVSFRMGALTVKPIDFTAAVAAVNAAGSAITPEWLIQNYRRLIPAVEGFAITDIAADIPDPSAPGSRTKFELGGYDLTLGDYVNGLPARIRTALSGLHVTLPDDEDTAPLRAMGYQSITLDASVALHWNRADQTIVVEEVATHWTDAARVRVSAVIGNATADLFGDSPALIQRAAMGLTLKSLTISLDDEGLLTKGIEMAAVEQNMEPGAFRQAVAAMVQGTVIVGLSGNADSLDVSKAMTDFVNGASPHLTLTATALDPAGISLADLEATQQDPRALLTRVRLQASTTPGAMPASSPPAPPPATEAPVAPPPPQVPATPTPEAPAPQGSAKNPPSAG